MVSPEEFSFRLVQRVGSVKADFTVRSKMEVDEAAKTVVITSSGQDMSLGSTIRAIQTFVLLDHGSTTQIEIKADVHITGRIATFGHRIIASKAEQVTVDAMHNVELLLETAGRAIPERSAGAHR